MPSPAIDVICPLPSFSRTELWVLYNDASQYTGVRRRFGKPGQQSIEFAGKTHYHARGTVRQLCRQRSFALNSIGSRSRWVDFHTRP